MKTVITLTLSLMLIASPAFAKVNVFTCEPEWQALVQAIGGEHVKTYSATTAYQDPHHIEARPSLIAKTRRADLLVCTGAELEIGWLPLLLRKSGNADVQASELGYFLAASHVERIEVPVALDRSQGDVHASGNPHVSWDPYRLQTIAKALSKRLQEIDPNNATNYQQKLKQFNQQWTTAITRWEVMAANLAGKKVIVYHKNWSYLLKWLGVEVIADLEPKPGLPPTSKHLSHLLSVTRDNAPDAILIANYQDDKGAKWLSNKTGIPVIQLPYTVGGSDQAIDLFSLYNEVLSLIIKETR